MPEHSYKKRPAGGRPLFLSFNNPSSFIHDPLKRNFKLLRQLFQPFFFNAVDKADHGSFIPRSSRPSRPVDIAFNVWQIGVDDIREIFDVDPARCDIGREKQCELSRLKCLQYFGALNFFRLAVKDADFYMMKFELFGIYV